MKNILAFIMLFGSTMATAQNDYNTIIEQFLEQRKEMMEEIMKAFDDDSFFQDEFFDDDVFEQLRQHGLGGFKGYQGAGNNISIQEKMNEDGTISVIITPKNKETNLDIETKQDRITIKSEVEVKEERKDAKGNVLGTSTSMQSFSRVVSIPQGYKAKSPTKKGESIVISLVPNDGNILKPDENGRVPIKKRPGEKTI